MNKSLFIIIFIAFFSTHCVDRATTVNYYFDAATGDDNNPGTSPEKPFKSLARIKQLKLNPGDSVLLKGGVVFEEQLFISCKGTADNPIIVGKYGSRARPHIKGDTAKVQAVYVYNSEHFVIRDLEISKSAPRPVEKMQGLLVELHNYGTGKNITIDNIYIHDLLAELKDAENSGGAAILVSNYRDNKTDSVSSNFDGLVIQNCSINNTDFGGIAMWGNWERKRWNPNRNVIIRNNILDGVGGHGIVPVACESPLVEYNVMKNSPQKTVDPDGIDGIWPWSCDNAVVQYNVVSDIKSQWDAYGFDADYNCTNSLFQYNLSYNNKGGFLLVCNSGGWSEEWSVGNKGSVIRYNVSINDGLRDYIGKNSKAYFSPVIHCTGSIKNTLIEKNILYVKKKPAPQVDKTILHLNNWGEDNFPDSTFFRNNFIFTEENTTAANAETSTNHVYQNNRFVGQLTTPAAGFVIHTGSFDKSLWYDENDKNWRKLVEFLRDKKVPIDGNEVPVWNLIGYSE